MAQEPNGVIFTCDSCDVELQADGIMAHHLLLWKRKLAIEPNGSCKACGGDSWEIAIYYIQDDTHGPAMLDQPLFGSATSLLTARLWLALSYRIAEPRYLLL